MRIIQFILSSFLAISPILGQNPLTNPTVYYLTFPNPEWRDIPGSHPNYPSGHHLYNTTWNLAIKINVTSLIRRRQYVQFDISGNPPFVRLQGNCQTGHISRIYSGDIISKDGSRVEFIKVGPGPWKEPNQGQKLSLIHACLLTDRTVAIETTQNNSSLSGSAGNDTLVGSSGNDRLGSPPLAGLDTLDTHKLRQIIVNNKSCDQYLASFIGLNRCIGRQFQLSALNALKRPENFKKYFSAQRQKQSGVRHVIPDSVGNIRLITRDSSGAITKSEVYKGIHFLEVKAVKNRITLSHSRYQILGMLDALEQQMQNVGAPRGIGLLTLVMAEDTRIGKGIKQEAQRRGIQIEIVPSFILPNDNTVFPVNYTESSFPGFSIVNEAITLPYRQASLNTKDTTFSQLENEPDPLEVSVFENFMNYGR